MKTVNTLAWANTKYNKGKNILSGIAITLTTLLVFLIISIGLGTVNTRNYAVNQNYPTWHAMYSDVSEQVKNQMVQHADIAQYGLRQDVGQVAISDGIMRMQYFDKQGRDLGKFKLDKGNAPKNDNEIALSTDALKEIGHKHAKLGDKIILPYQQFEGKGLGYQKKNEFTIVGLTTNTKQPAKGKFFSILVSKDFMAQAIPQKERSYRVYIRLADSQKMTSEDIEAKVEKLGKAFKISPEDIYANSDYLNANYVDPATNFALGGIILVILFAGAMMIYSIYYVSLINKVQEFGKLKALGANKRQIRQLILRENLLVAAMGIAAGLLLGAVTVKLFFNIILGSFYKADATMLLMKKAINSGAVPLIFPWVLGLTAVCVIAMVILSSLKPMRQASKIMPVEAMNYTGQSRKQKKSRKGFTDLNPRKLAEANLSRNKKRTLITVISLGILGVLFITVSTVCTCMQPKQIADDSIPDDFQLATDSRYEDKMHPDQTWSSIQQNNPLNKEMLRSIKSFDGVERVTPHFDIDIEIPGIKENGEAYASSIHGITKAQVKEAQQHIQQGKVSYQELQSGDKVMVSSFITRFHPEVKVGDTFVFKLFDGTKAYKKKLTIAAIGDLPQSIAYYGEFYMENEAVQKMSHNNLTYTVDVKSQKNHNPAINKQLKKIVKDNKYLILDSYDAELVNWQGAQRMLGGIAYGIMLVLGLVGIMNLINTTINSIVIRKKELGIMQAIGMSDRQLRHMLQSEGLVYSLGILLVSVIFGSLAGYGAFRYAVSQGHIMQIYTYHYPIIQVLLIVGIVLMVETILIIIITRFINKETIINRIHTSE